MKKLAAASLLLLQIGAIAHSRFVPTRYFCWAPYTFINRYRIVAIVDGRTLTPREIYARYHLSSAGVDIHSIHNVIDVLRAREIGERDSRVSLTYTVNDGREEKWEWRG